MENVRFCARARNMRPCRVPVLRCTGDCQAPEARLGGAIDTDVAAAGVLEADRNGLTVRISRSSAGSGILVGEEFLIVDFRLLIDNWDAPLGVQSTIATRQSTTGFTGPSTNGRSSAFGALCLGSNPSGPARIKSSVAVGL